MSKRILAVASFLTVFALVVFGTHLYIAQRMILDAGVDGPLRGVLLGTMGALGLSLLLHPICERAVGPPLSRVTIWPAALWLGFAFLLLTVLAASDVALALIGATAGAGGEGGPSRVAALRAGLVAAVALTAGAVALRSGLGPPRLERVTIRLSRWPAALDGYRIVQISDVHIGPILGRRFAAGLVERVNALGPDLVAVTGDLVDGAVKHLAADVAPFGALRARDGVFFVTGNHDYYSGAERWVDELRSLGLRPLRNQRVTIGTGEACFELAGVEDHHANLFGGPFREDLPGALADRPPGRPVVLLAHDPSTFKRSSQLGVDLQLSGHTHGGQIWPFSALVRLVVPFVAGRFEKDGCQLYVSRGTGFWGPPMRLFAPAEITEITLRPAMAHAAHAAPVSDAPGYGPLETVAPRAAGTLRSSSSRT